MTPRTLTAGRRARRSSSALLVLVLVSPAVMASPSDASARKAAERAMTERFAAADFEGARQALEQILASTCAAGCSQKTLAALHLDLGVVWVTGFRDRTRGEMEMRKARALDPKIALDPMVLAPDVQAAFDAAAAGPPGVAEQDVVLEEERPDRKKKHRVTREEEREGECSTNSDCLRGFSCEAGACVAPPPPPPPPPEPAVWLSFGLIQDAAMVSGDQACTKQAQVSGGFTCLRRSGSQYHGTPLPGHGGKVSGGLALATTRVTIATGFRLWDSLTAGLRMGYAFAGGGPQPDGGKEFLWLQAEAQGAYWLSGKGFSTDHVGTFVLLAGGVAEIDGTGTAAVQEDPRVPRPSNQLDNPSAQTLDVYAKAGSGFAGGGLGLFVPFGTGSGLLADLRASGLFPTSGFAISLGAGLAFGL